MENGVVMDVSTRQQVGAQERLRMIGGSVGAIKTFRTDRLLKDEQTVLKRLDFWGLPKPYPNLMQPLGSYPDGILFEYIIIILLLLY